MPNELTARNGAHDNRPNGGWARVGRAWLPDDGGRPPAADHARGGRARDGRGAGPALNEWALDEGAAGGGPDDLDHDDPDHDDAASDTFGARVVDTSAYADDRGYGDGALGRGGRPGTGSRTRGARGPGAGRARWRGRAGRA
ncbi:hypothetical protein BJF78_26720 [Pseudonocardia sp. CNS-139]|nr:hypothetical protein BJF78_26720 [Pseudonocardia sp. CNS-139]